MTWGAIIGYFVILERKCFEQRVVGKTCFLETSAPRHPNRCFLPLSRMYLTAYPWGHKRTWWSPGSNIELFSSLVALADAHYSLLVLQKCSFGSKHQGLFVGTSSPCQYSYKRFLPPTPPSYVDLSLPMGHLLSGTSSFSTDDLWLSVRAWLQK